MSQATRRLLMLLLSMCCVGALALVTAGTAVAQTDPNTPVDGATSDQVPQPQAGDPSVVNKQFLTFIYQDVMQTWTNWHQKMGLRPPSAQAVFIDPSYPFADPCTNTEITADTVNAFYCSANDTIELPMTTMNNAMVGQYFNRFNDPHLTNAGTAIVIAHELGHNEEAELESNGISGGQHMGDGTRWPELFADCAAGTWLYSAYYKGYMQPGDMASIMEGLSALGDTVQGGPMPHGTPQERTTAVMEGYNNGQPLRCAHDYLGVAVPGL